MKYYPLLRGKQNEMVALREMAEGIVSNGNVVPILEAVNSNPTTQKSIDLFIEKSMPFLFICNPRHGKFSNDADKLANEVISRALIDYNNWNPALYVTEGTTLEAFDRFTDTYKNYEIALVYYGSPRRAVRSRIEAAGVNCHAFVGNRVENSYIESIPPRNRILVVDSFHRQARNVDYPDQEFFTDLNTSEGNKDDVAFGDFSIVGDHYIETGRSPNAVVIHHIHFSEDSHSLEVRRFKSDRVDTPVDTSGKIIEAIDNLIASLDDLQPNDTEACNEYRTMSRDQRASSLGYLKRLSIKHHLEVILGDGGLEQQGP